MSMVDGTELNEERVGVKMGLRSIFGCSPRLPKAVVLSVKVVGGFTENEAVCDLDTEKLWGDVSPPLELVVCWLARSEVSGLFAVDDVTGMITGLNADRELEISLLEPGIRETEVVVMVPEETTARGVVRSCSIWGGFDSISIG